MVQRLRDPNSESIEPSTNPGFEGSHLRAYYARVE